LGSERPQDVKLGFFGHCLLFPIIENPLKLKEKKFVKLPKFAEYFLQTSFFEQEMSDIYQIIEIIHQFYYAFRFFAINVSKHIFFIFFFASGGDLKFLIFHCYEMTDLKRNRLPIYIYCTESEI
jgi:hypothetical protein